MRVNVNTRRSQTMPGMKKRMFTSASKASKPYMNKARGYLKREARRQYDTATAAIKAELEAKIVGGTIDEIEKHLNSYALKVRNPLGAGGRNFNAQQEQLVDQPAQFGTTESSSMFSYRSGKTRGKTNDTILYESVRNKKVDISSSAGAQRVNDRNLLVLEPPENDILASNDSWTNLSVKNEFERMLRALTTNDTASYELKKQALIAKFHALTSVMILRAPSTGAIVEIYDLKPKFGLGATTGSSEIFANGYMSPHWCWNTGLSSNTTETMDDYNEGVVGCDPTSAITFRRSWDIIKKTTVRMTPNSIHRHRLVFNINKSVTFDEMAQTTTRGGTAEWCPCQMIVARGYPTSTSLAEAVTVNVQQETKLKFSSRLADKSQVIIFNDKT